jgi:hypothetical protein
VPRNQHSAETKQDRPHGTILIFRGIGTRNTRKPRRNDLANAGGPFAYRWPVEIQQSVPGDSFLGIKINSFFRQNLTFF